MRFENPGDHFDGNPRLEQTGFGFALVFDRADQIGAGESVSSVKASILEDLGLSRALGGYGDPLGLGPCRGPRSVRQPTNVREIAGIHGNDSFGSIDHESEPGRVRILMPDRIEGGDGPSI